MLATEYLRERVHSGFSFRCVNVFSVETSHNTFAYRHMVSAALLQNYSRTTSAVLNGNVMRFFRSSTSNRGTRFRLTSPSSPHADSWSLNYLYIGPQCSSTCRGRGRCVDGACKCYTGFSGVDCVPDAALQDSLSTDFTSKTKLASDWPLVRGGSVITQGGCGVVVSGEHMHFSGVSVAN